MWKSRALFVLFCALVLAFAWFYNDAAISYVAVYAVALLLLFSLTGVLAAPVFIKITEQVDKRELFKGESLAYSSKVHNKSVFFYPKVRFRYYSSHLDYGGKEAVSLIPRHAETARSQVRFAYRGLYRIGIQEITVTDFLGLFHLTFGVNRPMDVTVFPRSDETFSLFIRNESQNTVFRYDIFNESNTDVADVRKYTPSDSFRKIHWKLSSKRNELMVKNYQSYEPNRTLLFLDTREIPLEDDLSRLQFEDKMVSFVSSAVDHCAQSRVPAYLVHGDRPEEQFPIDPGEGLRGVYGLLARIPFSDQISSFPMFCDLLDRNGTAYNLFLFLSDIDREAYDAVCRFTSLDHNLYLYFFYSRALPLTESVNLLLDNLKAQGVSTHKIEVTREPV